MRIAIGGMQKNEMQQAVLKADPTAETIITTDMGAVTLLKNGQADYYFGACESGGGTAISILIGMIGYNKCCTVCKTGGRPNKAVIEKHVAEGKICFGMAVSQIEETVSLLIEVLKARE